MDGQPEEKAGGEVNVEKRDRSLRRFTYRGFELKQLLDMNPETFMKHLSARGRRRFGRASKVKSMCLFRKLTQAKNAASENEKPELVRTHLRNMIIVPGMIGSCVGIYNGKTFNSIEIRSEMIGHYLGEFSITYKPVKHGRPGIGATHSSRMGYYEKAANVLEDLYSRRGTINGLVYSSDVPDKKRLLRTICNCIKYKEAIAEIVDKSELMKKERLKKCLAIVLVNEYLFNEGTIQLKSGRCQRVIQRNKARLRSELIRLKIRRKVTDISELVSEECMKSLDINEVRSHLKTFLEESHTSIYDYLQAITKGSTNKTFTMDTNIPELFFLPHDTDFHIDPLFLSGKIVLQEMASCFPAIALDPPQNSIVLDACSAPGNKTSHLSALMKNEGRIYAIERDERRLKFMKLNLHKLGCKNVEFEHKEFLDIDYNTYPYCKVEYILLDPTCTGSGIIKLKNKLLNLDDENDPSNISKLFEIVKYQRDLLSHALNFPNVQRVAYSTCSINKEENEEVVEEVVMKHNKHFRFKKDVLNFWTRRGDSEYTNDAFIRTCPYQDGTTGFFVAVIERIPKDT